MQPTTIFIPAYQAEQTIEAVIERIPEAFWPAVCEVLVINDGSTDDTSGAVRRVVIVYLRTARPFTRNPAIPLASRPTPRSILAPTTAGC